MSTENLDKINGWFDDVPGWFDQLGLHDPERCAADLAQSMIDDPFNVIGFTAIAAWHLGEDFVELVNLLEHYQPELAVALPEIVAAMPPRTANDSLTVPDDLDIAALPLWLRELDKIECTGVMRRYDVADRSASSYLIEARLADGQGATARLSLRHGEVDTISEFWTTCMSLRDASRFYRDRYAMQTKRPYRNVKPVTAGRCILDALKGSVMSGQILDDCAAPIPWPQNLRVLNLMLYPLLAQMQ